MIASSPTVEVLMPGRTMIRDLGLELVDLNSDRLVGRGSFSWARASSIMQRWENTCPAVHPTLK